MDSDVIIIGAGVVGLSIARSLSTNFEKIFLIEKNKDFGMEISSRNSEVIHSGIYYPQNSLKSLLCRKGNKLLYKYCKEKNIKYNRCGKYVIGFTIEDKIRLNRIKQNAKNDNIESVFLCREELKELEPNLNANYALFFKNSGVIDSHDLMNNINKDALNNDVDIVYKTEVEKIKKIKDGYELKIINPDGKKDRISTKILINSTGLNAFKIFKTLSTDDFNYKLFFWKGEYFSINSNKNKLLNSLIYPLPMKNNVGLGIHTIIDINGRFRLGPSAEYLGDFFNGDYSVNSSNKSLFFDSVKSYLPFLELSDLSPDFSGVRPKLQMPGQPIRDFVIRNEKDRGLPNFINLIGIESPGLTASLAIGNYVKDIINK